MTIGDITFHLHTTQGMLPKSKKHVMVTLCVMHHGPCATEERPFCGAMAITKRTMLSPKDVNRRATGIKIALARALAGLGLAKPARKVFWDAYHAKMGVPPSHKH